MAFNRVEEGESFAFKKSNPREKKKVNKKTESADTRRSFALTGAGLWRRSVLK